MAKALAKGLIEADYVDVLDVCASDVSSETLKSFKNMTLDEAYLHANTTGSNEYVVQFSDIVILTVKPHELANVLAEIKSVLNRSKLFVFIVPGFSLSKLQKTLGEARIIRVMPYTPESVHAVGAKYSRGEFAKDKDVSFVHKMLETVGIPEEVDEQLLDTLGLKVGFIGAGRMATALAKGLIQAKFLSASDVFASDIDASTLKQFQEVTKSLGIEDHLEDTVNVKVVKHANVVVLAVKPQVMSEVLDEIKDIADDITLFISIAAGVSLSKLQAALGEARIIRVMPNTPALVQAGASAFSKGKFATDDDARLVQQMLETVGVAFEVDEYLLDAVTGLSGSGPAYAFQMIEALSDGGVLMGLPRPTATKLAAQTLLGAALMVLETGEHPGTLKDAVTSPGGTTIAGLHELETGGMRGILINAVRAATLRSQELGK